MALTRIARGMISDGAVTPGNLITTATYTMAGLTVTNNISASGVTAQRITATNSIQTVNLTASALVQTVNLTSTGTVTASGQFTGNRGTISLLTATNLISTNLTATNITLTSRFTVTNATGFIVGGLRTSTATNVIYYNPTTKELTYGATPAGGGGGATNQLVNGTWTSVLTTSGNLTSKMFLANQGTYGVSGFSFNSATPSSVGGTGMFSAGNGQIDLYANNELVAEFLHPESVSTIVFHGALDMDNTNEIRHASTIGFTGGGNYIEKPVDANNINVVAAGTVALRTNDGMGTNTTQLSVDANGTQIFGNATVLLSVSTLTGTRIYSSDSVLQFSVDDKGPKAKSMDILTTSTVGDVIPRDDRVYNLGATGFRWQHLYLSTGTIYFDDVPFTIDTSTLYLNSVPIVDQNVTTGSSPTFQNLSINDYTLPTAVATTSGYAVVSNGTAQLEFQPAVLSSNVSIDGGFANSVYTAFDFALDGGNAYA